MSEEKEGTTKKGAIICKKKIAESDLMEYEALFFILNVPLEITDDQLKSFLNGINKINSNTACTEIIVRADINATSNEIWEQFKGLNNDAGHAKNIDFKDLNIIS